VGLAGCGTTTSPARSAVDASLARTEAAGSARFVTINTVVGSATSTTIGWVDFTRSQLRLVRYDGLPSSVTAQYEVRQLGHTLYHRFILVPTKLASPGGVVGYLGLSRWDVQHTDQPVTASIVPLGWFSGADRVTVIGRATVSGTGTMEYRVRVPGSTFSRAHLEPFYLYLWLDHEGRIRRASCSEVETGLNGRRGPLQLTISTTLSDFGAPGHVQAPPHAPTPRS